MGTIARRSYRRLGDLPLAVALIIGAPVGAACQETSTSARAPDVHFVPTDTTKVREMLTAAQVGPKDLVYDLGCGDGRIVISAVKTYGARGVCVDIDPVRIKESKSNADTAGVTGRIEFVEGDLFEQDLSKANVVTLYLLPSLNERLRPKLFRELRPGSRIVSNAFDMGDWKADRTLNVKTSSGMQSYAYLWILPADVSGAWELKPEGGKGKSYTLDIKQKYQEVSGTAGSGGSATPLSMIAIRGDQLSFTIGDDGTSGPKVEYTGTVSGDKAKGTAKGEEGSWSWQATRTKPGTRSELR
jgi:SAM-dependent methyltransferase